MNINQPTKINNEEGYYGKAESSTDWDSGNLLRVKDFVNEQYADKKSLRILEVGCGEANILDNINENIVYAGIDPSDHCNKNFDRTGSVSMKKGIAEDLPYSDGEFDLVFSNHALEHFYDPEKSLAQIDRVVKTGGYVVLVAPNHDLPWTKLNAIRHYSRLRFCMFRFVRFVDTFKRMFGLSIFRTIKDNCATVTEKFEQPDDDLMYVTSSMEVYRFFAKKKYSLIFANDKYEDTSSVLKNIIKKMIVTVPSLKYSQNNMFFILEK